MNEDKCLSSTPSSAIRYPVVIAVAVPRELMIHPPEEKHLPGHNGTASLQGWANSARKHCEREMSSDEITPREAAVTGQLNQLIPDFAKIGRGR